MTHVYRNIHKWNATILQEWMLTCHLRRAQCNLSKTNYMIKNKTELSLLSFIFLLITSVLYDWNTWYVDKVPEIQTYCKDLFYFCVVQLCDISQHYMLCRCILSWDHKKTSSAPMTVVLKFRISVTWAPWIVSIVVFISWHYLSKHSQFCYYVCFININ